MSFVTIFLDHSESSYLTPAMYVTLSWKPTTSTDRGHRHHTSSVLRAWPTSRYQQLSHLTGQQSPSQISQRRLACISMTRECWFATVLPDT